MTSIEHNQTRRQQDQAVVDALMSDDAARAIEILYRTVVHGIPVPDPDVVATLAVQPKHPARPRTQALRRHTWIRTAVPLAVGLAAVIGSLGWSYADYNDRQQEWQRIAEEQTALAKQQAELANQRAILLKQSEDARAQMNARDARLLERRRQVIALTEKEIAEGKLTDAAIATWIVAEEVLITEGKAAELADEYSRLMRSLLDRIKRQPTDGNDHGPR